MLHVDESGVPVTVAGPDAARGWDRVVDGWLSFAPDLAARLDEVLQLDPAMVAANTLRAWMFHYGHDPRNDRAVSTALETAEAAAGEATQRERDHVQAVRDLVAGDPIGAVARWDSVLTSHRRDIVALRCAYFDHYEHGDTEGTRRVAVDALDSWSDEDRWRPQVMGMAAFALSESDEYAPAERLGREAAERSPEDLWSVHAIAHVLEECARPREGLRWLDEFAPHLDPEVGFARHLWWHRALYALELGELDLALELYDREISASESDNHLDLCNRISLIARLQLLGADVADRWAELVDGTRRRIDDHRSLFFHAHIALAQAWDPGGDPEAVLRSVEEWARHDERARELGVDLVRAILVWNPDDPAEARRWLTPVRDKLGLLGGSRAQRSLFAAITDSPDS